MTDKKEIKIEFAPGCFDSFEGTQEELEALIEEIKNMVASGDFQENSRELTDEDFEELPEEVQEKLAGFFENDEYPKRTLN